MVETASDILNPETQVTVEEVKRILEVGRLLLSVLDSRRVGGIEVSGWPFPLQINPCRSINLSSEIGNTGVT